MDRRRGRLSASWPWSCGGRSCAPRRSIAPLRLVVGARFADVRAAVAPQGRDASGARGFAGIGGAVHEDEAEVWTGPASTGRPSLSLQKA